ncbi:hypothetical protein AGR4C_Cc160180 [Agrobacterium tumefaciens str. Kerr 14]|uniref:Uncharacterized protein n=1 Tax=Agrobacterium tumefaciens str. Kerr 14 TaxID=1183424 RepID=A0A1S7P7P6_AGRTU|nr:hypothetical protein AGR4C_Cc160180 [Agrobacterium tumefaciens str. Kerr 14]
MGLLPQHHIEACSIRTPENIRWEDGVALKVTGYFRSLCPIVESVAIDRCIVDHLTSSLISSSKDKEMGKN